MIADTWQRVLVAGIPAVRVSPSLSRLFTNFIEIHGDRRFATTTR